MLAGRCDGQAEQLTHLELDVHGTSDGMQFDSAGTLVRTLEMLELSVAIARAVAHLHSHLDIGDDTAPGQATGVLIHRYTPCTPSYCMIAAAGTLNRAISSSERLAVPKHQQLSAILV